ncbi:MAG: hypothetical protein Fur002_22870 [Anaerolineales bacterium]
MFEKAIAYVKGRFPDRQNIIGVYAFVVFFVYAWTLLVSFYKIPSWILFLTPSQILSIYAYNFSVNLLESFFVLLCLLVLDYTIFLPLKNKEEFQARSIFIAVILLASSMWRLIEFQEYSDVSAFVSGERAWWLYTLAIAFPVAILAPKIKKVREILQEAADRLSIFLYVYLPLSFISLVVLIIRNIS